MAMLLWLCLLLIRYIDSGERIGSPAAHFVPKKESVKGLNN